MKVLFLQIEPSQSLKGFLEAQGWESTHLKRIPSKARTPGEELVVFAPKSMEELSHCKKIRTALPDAWICVLFRSTWINKIDAEEESATLGCSDEIWMRDNWEKLFRLSLNRLQRHYINQYRLQTLSKEATELKGHCEELTEKSSLLVHQLERDVSLASNIQRALMPQKTPEIQGIHLKAKYVPAGGPGGDYYDLFEFGDNKRLGILLADAKSHGMAASLLTVLIKIRLEQMKDKFPDSNSFVQHLNKEINSVHQKEFASLSLLYGILDRSNLTFQYTVAGQLAPVLWRLGEIAPINHVSNPALGEVSTYDFKQSIMTLKPSDLLLFSTDGLDAPLRVEESQSRQQKLSEILQSADASPDLLATQNEIFSAVSQHKEKQELNDDITLIQLFIDSQTVYVASESK